MFQSIVNKDIHNIVQPLLIGGSNAVLIETCELMKVLTLDDDIREHISRAHEHARLLAIKNLCDLCDLLGSKCFSIMV